MKIQVEKDILLQNVRVKSSKEIFQCIDGSRDYLRDWLPFVDETKTWKDTEQYIKSIVHAKGATKDLEKGLQKI